MNTVAAFDYETCQFKSQANYADNKGMTDNLEELARKYAGTINGTKRFQAELSHRGRRSLELLSHMHEDTTEICPTDVLNRIEADRALRSND